MNRILTIACFVFAAWTAEAAEQPNILLIYADDLGYETLNCYGGLDFKTPQINRMAGLPP